MTAALALVALSFVGSWTHVPHAIAVVAHASAVSTTTNTVSTSGVDTTGATLIVLAVPFFSAVHTVDALDISDSKGNSYTALAVCSSSGTAAASDIRFFYIASPVVGAAHTVSLSSGGAAVYPSIAMIALSGTAASPLDQQNCGPATTTGDTTRQPGSVTPSENSEIVITGVGLGGSNGSIAIDSSFTIADSNGVNAGQGFGDGLAYIIQTSAGAVNPTWSATAPDFRASVIATFKASGGTTSNPAAIVNAPIRSGGIK